MTYGMASFLAALCVGVAAMVGLACVLIWLEANDQDLVRRIEDLRAAGSERRPNHLRMLSVLISLLRRLGNAMRSKVLSERDRRDVEGTLAASGFDPSRLLPIFVGAKILCLVIVPTLAFSYAAFGGYTLGQQVLFAGLAFPLAVLLPNWAVSIVRRTYQNALRRGLPDALDLLVVCAEAGLGLESAVERVSREMRRSNPAVSWEFSLLSNEMRMLPDRRQAIANLGARTRIEGFRRLSATLAQSIKYGTPLSQALRVLAGEMRNERLIQFEERAAKLPALMVLPLVLFILPCLFIVLIGPSFIQLLKVFGGQE